MSCLVILLMVVDSTGCGYRLGGYPSQSPTSVQKVEVPLFENLTHEPRVENTFTSAFRHRLQALPDLSLSARSQAEAVLKGKILAVESDVVAVDREFMAMEYRLTILLSLSLQQSKDGGILWTDDNITDDIRFYASSDPLLVRDNREEALIKLSHRIAERALDQMILQINNR